MLSQGMVRTFRLFRGLNLLVKVAKANETYEHESFAPQNACLSTRLRTGKAKVCAKPGTFSSFLREAESIACIATS